MTRLTAEILRPTLEPMTIVEADALARTHFIVAPFGDRVGPSDVALDDEIRVALESAEMNVVELP